MDFAYQGKNPTTKLAAMASASNIQHTQSAEVGSQTQVHLTTSLPMPITSALKFLIKAKNKSQ
jgi:hypothetical protein